MAAIGVAGDVAVPVLELPSPQPTVYAQGASAASGSVNVAARVTVSPGFDFMSGPALTVGAAPWQLVEPESLKVFPATCTNCQL